MLRPLTLCFTTIFLIGSLPAHAQLNPSQKAQAQQDIDRQLKAFKHDPSATTPPPKLKASIHNATPEQYDEYKKLKKDAQGRYVNDPNDPRSPLYQLGPKQEASGRYNPADGGVNHRSDCAQRPHPELDPWCRTLSPSLGR
ncbi:hypothetical protein KPL74_17450 [Bacillus sp. NP157]|nr:hypothetical protein KPL74_17450 [Bacillus sp. NP157]